MINYMIFLYYFVSPVLYISQAARYNYIDTSEKTACADVLSLAKVPSEDVCGTFISKMK